MWSQRAVARLLPETGLHELEKDRVTKIRPGETEKILRAVTGVVGTTRAKPNKGLRMIEALLKECFIRTSFGWQKRFK